MTDWVIGSQQVREVRKSSRSAYNGNCVEAGRLDDDGTIPYGNPIVTKRGDNYVLGSTADDHELVFTPAEWDAFVQGVRDGEFEDLRH